MTTNLAKPKIAIDKDTQFFVDDFIEFSKDTEANKLVQSVEQVIFQCLGYGLVDSKYEKEALQNFINYVANFVSGQHPKLYSVKIILNGFDMEQEGEYKENNQSIITKIAKQISKVKTLKYLYIQLANVKNVLFNDFKQLLYICLNVQGEENGLERLDIQCSNWQFKSLKPTAFQIRTLLEDFINKQKEKKLSCKYFRLQFSGWYSTEIEAQHFLRFKREKQVDNEQLKNFTVYTQNQFEKRLLVFQNGIKETFKGIVQNMPKLQNFQIDMRNNNKKLKLINLKKMFNTQVIQKNKGPQNQGKFCIKNIII